jgi:hypothetical protein
MDRHSDRLAWGLSGIGVAGVLTILFAVASLPKPPDNEVLNESAINTLSVIDNVEAMVGQDVPMTYDGAEYLILLDGVSKHITANKAPETCYDFRISQDGVTLGVASRFIAVEEDRHGCTID